MWQINRLVKRILWYPIETQHETSIFLTVSHRTLWLQFVLLPMLRFRNLVFEKKKKINSVKVILFANGYCSSVSSYCWHCFCCCCWRCRLSLKVVVPLFGYSNLLRLTVGYVNICADLLLRFFFVRNCFFFFFYVVSQNISSPVVLSCRWCYCFVCFFSSVVSLTLSTLMESQCECRRKLTGLLQHVCLFCWVFLLKMLSILKNLSLCSVEIYCQGTFGLDLIVCIFLWK